MCIDFVTQKNMRISQKQIYKCTNFSRMYVHLDSIYSIKCIYLMKNKTK